MLSPRGILTMRAPPSPDLAAQHAAYQPDHSCVAHRSPGTDRRREPRLGADSVYSDRRSSERIRVSLEKAIRVVLEKNGNVVAEALLTDVAPRGIACTLEESQPLAATPDRLHLVWNGAKLLSRDVTSCSVEPTLVRRQPRLRARIVTSKEGAPVTWALPRWAGSSEFGAFRASKDVCGPYLIQAALLARDEVTIVQAVSSDDLEAALDLSYGVYVADGVTSVARQSRSVWGDAFNEYATVLVAHAYDIMVGPVRLVPDGPWGLPLLEYCPRELWPDRSLRSVEASRFAVPHLYRPAVNARLGIASLLVACAIERASTDGFDRLIIAARAPHERFYVSLGADLISPPFRHSIFGLNFRLFALDLKRPGVLRHCRHLAR